MNDEIGELSRNFGTLLTQVDDYTGYLKTLSSKLSHELRTPLAIVSSSLDNLEHEPLDSSARAFAKRAKEGSNRLSLILNSMSAATRVEQAVQNAEFEPVQMHHFLEEITRAYTDIYPSHTFTCSIEGEPEALTTLAAPELLAQMLDKLVDNAVDFSPPNTPIDMRLRSEAGQISLSIANSGPPLPEGMEKQLFDSLVSVRSEQGSKTDTAHLGLGLYIVSLIVECHKGSIRARNRPQSGVVFELKIPRRMHQ
jgi:signal transduction histidine kinase